MERHPKLKNTNTISPTSPDCAPSAVKQNEIVYAIMGAYPYSRDWANGLSANYQKELLRLAHAAKLADGRNVFLKMHGGVEFGDSDSSWYPREESRINCLKKLIDGKRVLKADGKSLYMLAEGVAPKDLLVSQSLVDLLAKHKIIANYDVNATTSGGGQGFPDEVDYYSDLVEGAVKQVIVNAYERNPKARKACIQHYGFNCTVCNFNFKSTYGVIGQTFIHVHHLLPLAIRDSQYQVDPIADLRPVCPNCHSMLHASDPPFSIEEIKELLDSAKADGPTRPVER